jgi:hypothetical protein
MDIDALREIITAVQGLGGDAKEAFVWYLVLTYLPGYVLGAVWTCGGLVVLFRLVGILRGLAGIEAMREAAGVSICWGSGEWQKALRIIREHWND